MTLAGLLLATTACSKSVSGDAAPVVSVPAPVLNSAPTSAAPTSAAPTAVTSEPVPSPAATSPASTAPASTAPASTAPTSTAPASSSAAPTPAVPWKLPPPKQQTRKNNQFGNQIAVPGQTYTIGYTGDKQAAVRFVVDSLKVDTGCDKADKPTNGHFLVISMRLQLGNYAGTALSDDGIGFRPSDWTAFDAKNVAEVGTAPFDGGCVTDSAVPFTDTMQQGQVYQGKIALDVSAVKGTVVLLSTISGGWVYSYG